MNIFKRIGLEEQEIKINKGEITTESYNILNTMHHDYTSIIENINCPNEKHTCSLVLIGVNNKKGTELYLFIKQEDTGLMKKIEDPIHYLKYIYMTFDPEGLICKLSERLKNEDCNDIEENIEHNEALHSLLCTVDAIQKLLILFFSNKSNSKKSRIIVSKDIMDSYMNKL